MQSVYNGLRVDRYSEEKKKKFSVQETKQGVTKVVSLVKNGGKTACTNLRNHSELNVTISIKLVTKCFTIEQILFIIISDHSPHLFVADWREGVGMTKFLNESFLVMIFLITSAIV